MKSCPICNRTYGDDTLSFCLDDGAHLSASYDPHATLKGPAARETDPPRTEAFPPHLAPGNQEPAPFRPSNAAFAPVAYPQAARQSQFTEKRRAHWIILSGTLALMVFGLLTVLGYMTWKANNISTPEPSNASSTAPANSKGPVNQNRDAEAKPPVDSSSQWLEGAWEGEGYQTDTKTTWAVRLKVQDGSYAIEYPDIPCRGRWTLIDQNSAGASFTEVITEGTDLCSTNSHVLIEKLNDSEISCQYTHAGSRAVIATATLSKKAPATEQR